MYPDYPAIGMSPAVPDAMTMSGKYGLGRWTHRFSDRSDLAMRFSVSDEDRGEGFGQLDVLTPEFDFQHHLALSPRHDLMWGVGLEIYRFNVTPRHIFPAPSSDVQFIPAHDTEALGSIFAEDQIAVSGRTTLTLGAKTEHTGYSGFDIQPSARLLCNATPQQVLWASVSRAVRMPAIADRDTVIVFQPTLNPAVEGLLSGNPNLRPERALAYEAGYRNQPARWVTLDLATFFRYLQRLTNHGPGCTVPGNRSTASAGRAPCNSSSTTAAGHTLWNSR